MGKEKKLLLLGPRRTTEGYDSKKSQKPKNKNMGLSAEPCPGFMEQLFQQSQIDYSIGEIQATGDTKE